MLWTVHFAREGYDGLQTFVCVAKDGFVSAVREQADGSHVGMTLTDQQKTEIFNDWQNSIEGSLLTIVSDFYSKVLQGKKADMPVAGQPGGEERFYIATDDRAWYRDNGSSWELMFGADAGQEEPSQRSLGTESQEAAAGNHTH